uniref:Uncharacterized protein n=1 Tax=Caenorhabditis japonica TaxID=281687 RepID=A0A8R1I9B1_CAEJA
MLHLHPHLILQQLNIPKTLKKIELLIDIRCSDTLDTTLKLLPEMLDGIQVRRLTGPIQKIYTATLKPILVDQRPYS